MPATDKDCLTNDFNEVKVFYAMLLVTAAGLSTYAQSCCCTGAGANYSILPNLNRHIIGMRYSYRNFYNEVNSLNPDLDGKVMTQHLHTTELFGRFNLTEKLQLSALLPVNFIRQKNGNQVSNTTGLGDMSLLLQYQVLNPLRCNGNETKHQLRLGAGVKLPSGNFEMDKAGTFATNLQLGSGSVDFIGNAVYTLRYRKFGVNVLATYRYNTVNPEAYRFGDKAQAGASFFYVFDVSGITLMPQVGITYEHQFENRYNKKLLTYTGGSFLYTHAGFDVYYKNFAFSSAFTPALMNQLNWEGENKNRYNFEVGVFYNFSTVKPTK
jgi:hypothetical protein